MKHYLQNEANIKALLKDTDNYIVISDGQAVKQNIEENEIEVLVEDHYDNTEICNHKRCEAEENIERASRFTTVVNIYKSSSLKVIRINDENKNSSIVFNISNNAEVEITNIYFQVEVDTNALVEIVCDDFSKVNYTSIQTSKNEFNEYLNVFVDRGSTFKLNTLSLNETKAYSLTNIYMHGLYSNAIINNAIINNTSEKQTYDYNVLHVEKETTSDLVNYAICKDNSVLNINSNGIIKQGCSKSKIIQKSKGIILDLTSAISANPLLQIDEFDVEANHGASIGAIDDEDLYYLMSRGLTRTESEHLIVSAYMNPMIKNVNDELVVNYINNLLKNKL